MMRLRMKQPMQDGPMRAGPDISLLGLALASYNTPAVVNSFKKGNVDCLLAIADGLNRGEGCNHYIDTVNKGQQF